MLAVPNRSELRERICVETYNGKSAHVPLPMESDGSRSEQGEVDLEHLFTNHSRFDMEQHTNVRRESHAEDRH